MKTAISVINECHARGLEFGVGVLNLLLAFLCENNIRSGILYKKYDLSNVEIFQNNSISSRDPSVRISTAFFFFFFFCILQGKANKIK